MNVDKKELMLDLLCKQATYGLDEQETKQLEQLGYDNADAESIEMTYLDHGHWKDLTKTVPAAAGLSCPVTMPGPIVVRRLIVHSRS